MLYNNIVKPFFDRGMSLLLLIIFLPVILLIILILAATQNGKVFFTQDRPGLNERVFRLIKFKTMNDKKDKDGNLLPDMQRMHNAGKFLRKTSLDELPQLINVLKGDMSFVGPRPLLISYLTLYSEEQRLRHTVKPGITGWAQVNGRNNLSWTKKFELDIWYVKHQSLLLDVKILFLTVYKVFRTSEINTSSTETMPLFDGKN